MLVKEHEKEIHEHDTVCEKELHMHEIENEKETLT
jgi:hypothetical protein